MSKLELSAAEEAPVADSMEESLQSSVEHQQKQARVARPLGNVAAPPERKSRDRRTWEPNSDFRRVKLGGRIAQGLGVLPRT